MNSEASYSPGKKLKAISLTAQAVNKHMLKTFFKWKL
jgi:hypothetical protein